MTRLLARATSRSADPELFAGLVQACRYAEYATRRSPRHAAPRRLDPSIRTSVAHAYLMNGDYRHAIEKDCEESNRSSRRLRWSSSVNGTKAGDAAISLKEAGLPHAG